MRAVVLIGVLGAGCSFQGGGMNPGLGDDVIAIDAPPPIDTPAPPPPLDHPGGALTIVFDNSVAGNGDLIDFPVMVTLKAGRIDYLAVTDPHSQLGFKQGQVGLRLGDNAKPFRGRIDEFRVAHVTRTDAWIAAQDRSMRDLFNTYTHVPL